MWVTCMCHVVPERQLNMRGVFLHVLGDALGSVIVIISALVIKYTIADWKYKVDPILRWLSIAYSFVSFTAGSK